MLCRFKIISNRMLQFSFKSRSNYWKNNDIKIDKINNDVIQPEEIRKIIRKFQVKKEKFSESMYFKSWKTSVQAISLFQKFLNKNSNFLVNIEIFEEIKIFLENVIVSPFNSEDKFFYENFCGILNKIFSEFSNLKEIKLGNPSFFDENYNYSISSFRFLKSLLEIEYLVKNDYFINNFFQLIEVLSDQIIEKMFNNNNSIFVRNIKIIDEYFSILIKIFGGRFIESYNSKYFLLNLKIEIEKIFIKLEKYFLFKTIIQNDVNLENYEIILMTCLTFAHNSFINLKCVDYINFYLLKNASSINIYKLIDVLNLLSQYENIINYQIINFLYDKVIKEEQSNLLNYPKNYLVKIIQIFSKNFISGAFIISEKITNIILLKQDYNLFKSNEILALIIAILKSKNLNMKTLEIFIKLLMENFTINYVKSRTLKTFIERFININYDNPEFFNLIFLKTKEKLKDLETFRDNYDNKKFIEYIKEECIKESIIPETITHQDYIKYINILNTIGVNCCFKTKQDYTFTDINVVIFENNETFVFL